MSHKINMGVENKKGENEIRNRLQLPGLLPRSARQSELLL